MKFNLKNLDKKTWLIIGGVAVVLIALIITVVAVSGKGDENASSVPANTDKVVSAEYNFSDDQHSTEEYVADPAQKGEMQLADDSLTNKDLEFGRSWYNFNKDADIVSESYSFMPDGTYTYRCRYSVEAGGKFINETGTYYVPEKGVLTLYPDGETGTIYDYKIEENKLYLRKKGTEEWSQPYEMSDNI